MGLVSTWLTGIGLTHAIPAFKAAGIVTPASLAELDLQHYEALGVKDAAHRRKLFYLVQRIKMANSTSAAEEEEQAQIDLVISQSNNNDSDVVADDEKTEDEEGSSTSSDAIRARALAPISSRENRQTNRNRRNRLHNNNRNEEKKEFVLDNESKDSDWEDEDGESSAIADDEASAVGRRTSRRLQEKATLELATAAAVSPSETTDTEGERELAPPSRRRSAPASRAAPSSLGYSGDAENTNSSKGKRQSSRLVRPSSDADDESSSTGRPNRRFESKLPTTRKQLSTIPADAEAPMSPFVSRLGEPPVERKKKNMVAPSRLSYGSDNDDKSQQRRAAPSSTSGSDTEVAAVRRARARVSTGGIATNKRTAAGKSSRKSTAFWELKGQQQDSSKTGGETTSKSVFVHGAANDDKSWFGQVTRLREDNQHDHELFDTRSDDNDFEDDMRIRVLIRKRPMSTSEGKSGKELDVIHPLEYDGYGRILVYQPKTRVDLTREVETVPFAFDNVFDEGSTNKDIYERTVRALIPDVFEQGKWASVFAYGQTGSGKTYTMMGCNVTGIRAGNSKDDKANYGLYYMAAKDVFSMANQKDFSHMSIGISLFEIYGGKLFDLLNERKQIKCLEDHSGRVCFPGLSEHPVTSADEVMEVIENGACKRSTGTTSKNADSSRSHAILQLHIRKKVGRKDNVEHGRLTFIDLAGSERGADTSKQNRTTRLEGAEINTSLLALKEVIRALATGDSMAHIPFRGSKLTQVLKESFVGDNCRSVMVACIAPNISNCEHTLNTLRYADRVKERNAESGALSAPARGTKRMSSRLSLLPDTQLARVSSREEQQDDTDDDEEFVVVESQPEVVKSSREGQIEVYDILSHDLSADSVLLDELLAESKAATSVKKSVDSATVSDLVSTHRSVMTEMLGMVKDEMTLVNSADRDRDTIDTYLEQVERIHQKQCTMLTTLHEKLLAFRGGATDDDDSFEDLRD